MLRERHYRLSAGVGAAGVAGVASPPAMVSVQHQQQRRCEHRVSPLTQRCFQCAVIALLHLSLTRRTCGNSAAGSVGAGVEGVEEVAMSGQRG